MTKSDLRKQQIALLKFERVFSEQAENIKNNGNVDRFTMAGGLVSVLAISAVTSVKLGSLEPIGHASSALLSFAANAADGQTMLLAVAEKISAGHAAVERLAIDGGMRLLEASGGNDKGEPPVMVVRSILGL